MIESHRGYATIVGRSGYDADKSSLRQCLTQMLDLARIDSGQLIPRTSGGGTEALNRSEGGACVRLRIPMSTRHGGS